MNQQSFRLGCASPSRGPNFKSCECYCRRSNFGTAASKSEQAGCFFPTRSSLLAISSYTPSDFLLSCSTTSVHIGILCSTILLHSRTLFQSTGSTPETDYRNISVMNRYFFWTGSLLLWILVTHSLFNRVGPLGLGLGA